MKLAITITGIIGLMFIVIGFVVKMIGKQKEDTTIHNTGNKIIAFGSLFMIVFFVLLFILFVQVLFTFL